MFFWRRQVTNSDQLRANNGLSVDTLSEDYQRLLERNLELEAALEDMCEQMVAARVQFNALQKKHEKLLLTQVTENVSVFKFGLHLQNVVSNELIWGSVQSEWLPKITEWEELIGLFFCAGMSILCHFASQYSTRPDCQCS